MNSEVICLKYFCYIFVKDEGFGENGFRLIGRDFVTFAVNGIQLCSRCVLGYTCGLWVLVRQFESIFACWSPQCCGRLVRLVRVYVVHWEKWSGERQVQ